MGRGNDLTATGFEPKIALYVKYPNRPPSSVVSDRRLEGKLIGDKFVRLSIGVTEDVVDADGDVVVDSLGVISSSLFTLVAFSRSFFWKMVHGSYERIVNDALALATLSMI